MTRSVKRHLGPVAAGGMAADAGGLRSGPPRAHRTVGTWRDGHWTV